MGLTKVVLFIVLATLSTSTAFNTVTPWDKEVIYNWRALVKAGTHYPVSFGSQVVLHGKVHVQANNNATHVKIKDLTYKLYNGPIDHIQEHKPHSVPLPPEVEDIHKVFKIVHDNHGQAIGIATEHQEKEFSRNIKRAVASIFQIHDSVVKEAHKHPHAFVTHEHTIHGYGEENYNVIPHHDEEVEVHKMHHMRNSHHLYQYLFTNTEPTHCDAGFEEPLMHGSTKRYVITKQDGHHVIKHIEAVGVITYYPHQAKSISHFIITNQTFELVQVVPVQEKLQVQQEHYDNHLTYYAFDEVEHEIIPDITHGRHVVNYEKLLPKVKEVLQDAHEYLHKDHIHTEHPDTKNGQAINRVQRVLKLFTFEKLKELHETLSGDTLHIYHHILPLVGTRASVLFVKHLLIHKKVDDRTAVEMLQHLPEHVVIPSIDLLKELEDLIHLNEDIHWNVRRVAILSFASFIHKSHQHQVAHHKREQHHTTKHHTENVDHHEHENHHDISKEEDHNIQQQYEKYVTEYINKIRSSQDYKVQMTYILALFNMKLHSIAKHLVSAFNGDWWHDRHLQFISAFAAAPSVLADQDPDTVFEIFWPVMTDRDAHTEIRILAYHFIMESQPTVSRLKNIYAFLVNEPNEEVYHYHYTYVHSLMHSSEPCRQQTRVKMAQLMKFMQPPSHGQSSVDVHDYTDPTYGFSASVQNYHIRTNESHFYGGIFTSQQSHILVEDYMFYFKIHGIQQYLSDSASIFTEILRNKIPPKIATSKDIHIELVIIRHDHVINTYFFNQDNLHELSFLLDYFVKDSHSLIDDLLHISYGRYHKALIPTELGTPALWEYSLPVLHHHNISVVKEVSNKIINVHVHNRYVVWSHLVHGLSFYNPIADVWHGVNNYHAYDAVLPVHLDLNINTQQQSLQISWNKHNDPRMNVAGLRSHTKQTTFIRDDYRRSILAQSSPESKEWHVVSRGKEYRKDYTLINEDDLNTGHKFYVGKYDCGYHVSNGSFSHRMHLFTQPFTKNVDSPISHFLMSYMNFQHFALLAPRAGNCGFIVRVEPSHEHDVSNIDLSVRVHQEKMEEEKYHYTFGHKINARVTYAVKNKEQSLKTWDINTIVDMNPGHTVNSLKMQLTRIVPGQKDYKICVDRVKKWTKKEVSSHLSIAATQNPEGKCVKDDTVIDVTMTGKRSHEQDHEHHIYGSCHYVIPYSVPQYHTLHCLGSHTSVRHFVYNVKTTNVPSEFKKIVSRWWDRIKGHYMSYYTYQDEHTEDLGENNFKIDVLYPMQEETVDVHITTPQHVYGISGVPTHSWGPWILKPDTLSYPALFILAHATGHVDHCVVHHDHHHLNHHHHVQEVVPNVWKLYVGDDEQNPHKAIYVKHIADDKIAVKVVDQDHTLEIVPQGDHHQITVDGQVVPNEEHHHYKDWVSLLMFHHTVDHSVAAMLHMSGFHLEYDGHHVVIVIPKLHHDKHWHGQCYSRSQ